MDLEALLRAHGSLKLERPPRLWAVDAEEAPFLQMLGEMIALGLGRGTELADLTLNISNVTVGPDDEDGSIPEGDYVAVTVRGAGAWEDDVWRSGEGPTEGMLSDVGPTAGAAGAVHVYARDLGSEGSVTALLPRLPDPA